MKKNELYTLGIDIGSTTVKIAVLGACLLYTSILYQP